MSARSSIVNSLVEIIKTNLNGDPPYNNNIFGNAENKLVFWDEVNDFPFISATAGPETRDYLPGGFKWGYLTITLRVYVSDSGDSNSMLENLLSALESLIDANREVPYLSATGQSVETTDVRITSITTDEGLLHPYGVAEVDLEVQYQV